MNTKNGRWIDRREALKLMGAGAGAAWLNNLLPAQVFAQSQNDTLVLGIDISDIVTLDPARIATYNGPIIMDACYDTLVTMTSDDMVTIKPRLAKSWAPTPDGKGWRFTMREGLKFNSGNPVTIEDVKWSFDRVVNVKDQPAGYITHVESTAIVDKSNFDIIQKKPGEPLLTILCAPEFIVYERKVVEAQGGTDAADAKEKDKAITWLNSNSAGTGAYTLVGWERNSQIQLVRNEHYWGKKPAYRRVLIRHLGDGAAQLLAVRRGDISVAFNLIPEQVASLKGDKDVRLESLHALDFVYMPIMQEAEVNKALAVKECRQAIAYAIDYDGIIKNLIGGAAVRPAHFLPIGVLGSTPEIAKEIGYRLDLDKAKDLLKKGGYPNGFEFELAYGKASVVGVPYESLALKLQDDLARVGIKANLRPQDQLNMRTDYLGGKFKGGVLTYWNPQSIENLNWAEAVVRRVAKRVRWDVPKETFDFTFNIPLEKDENKRKAMWIEWQKMMIDQANHIVFFQPVYQIAVRNNVDKLPLTAAGWQIEVSRASPKA